MNNFHLLAIALVLGVVSFAFHSIVLFIILMAVLLVVVSLGVTFPQMNFFGKFICRGKKTRRCVALTFDDGPDANSTPQLLDLLAEANVEAAFFCVGERVAANPALAMRIVQEGHLLQNHSYTHSNFTNIFSVARLRTELSQTQNAIQQATGMVPQFFRPPCGLSNPRVFRVARELSLAVIGWSARGLDTKISDPDRVVARIMKQVGPGGIILLHDGKIPAPRLVSTIKLLLSNLRQEGYDVVRLDTMLE